MFAACKSPGRFSNCTYACNIAYRKEILDTFSEKKAKKLAERFAKNKTWQCPTLVMLRRNIGYDKRFVDKNPLKYFTPQLIESWDNHFIPLAVNPDDAETTLQKEYFQKQLDLVRLMHEAGVKFLAGTDSGDTLIFPGFSLHDELELLVSAGFTPMEAIETATFNVAEFHDSISYGSVEKGKIADLVLLENNPLQNIANTRKIAGVILNGK